ncbi:hypothetical protein QE152_g33067 [Popillia japonica]|uniref:CCHC-type domain-containing protein n=1 Tax=Popillia japonica TaxID=7064 RepID=A0AAW1IYA0_POPJA
MDGKEIERMPRARANTFLKDGMDDAGRKSTKRLREEEESDHLQELRKQFDRLAKTMRARVAANKKKVEVKETQSVSTQVKPENTKKDDEKKMLVANKIRMVIETFNTRTRANTHVEKSSAVHLLPLNIDATGVNDMEAVYEKIVQLKENISMHPTENISLVISEGLKFSYVRKIYEYVFTKQKLKIKLLTQTPISDPKQRKKKEESIVTVKAQGKSFVDIVKKLKEEVNIDNIGVKVKKLQKTGKGCLRLTVDGGQDMANLLQNEIKRKIDDVQVATRKLGMTTIFVLGMDPTTRGEEVRHAIAADIKVNETDIKIRAIRTGKNEEQTVIAEIPSDQALPLIKLRKLRIGWTECGIRERIDIVRCFRCLQYGHKTRECKAQIDRSKDCIKCGEASHKGKDCTNRNRCVKCNMDGHRADQFKCPYFTKLVEDMRKQKIQPVEARARRNGINVNRL